MNAFLYSPVTSVAGPHSESYTPRFILLWPKPPPTQPTNTVVGTAITITVTTDVVRSRFYGQLITGQGKRLRSLFVYTSLLWDRDSVQQKTRVPGFSLTGLTRA